MWRSGSLLVWTRTYALHVQLMCKLILYSYVCVCRCLLDMRPQEDVFAVVGDRVKLTCQLNTSSTSSRTCSTPFIARAGKQRLRPRAVARPGLRGAQNPRSDFPAPVLREAPSTPLSTPLTVSSLSPESQWSTCIRK